MAVPEQFSEPSVPADQDGVIPHKTRIFTVRSSADFKNLIFLYLFRSFLGAVKCSLYT